MMFYRFSSELIKGDDSCCPSKLKMFGDYENLADLPKPIADPYGVNILICIKKHFQIK